MGKIVKGMVSSMDFVWWEMENVKHENFNYFLRKKDRGQMESGQWEDLLRLLEFLHVREELDT